MISKTVRKIFALLSAREKCQMCWLFVAILIMAIVEVVGVASIMPFMVVLSKPGMIGENRLLSWLFNALHFTNNNSFLVFLGICVLLALVLSNACTAATTWAILRFTYMRSYTLSKRFLVEYIHRPYLFFVSRNSSDLSKNVLSEVSSVVSGVFVPGMDMIARSVVILLIMSLLFVAEPILALVMVIVIGGPYVLIYLLAQKKIVKSGRISVLTNKQRYRITSELFGGAKDIKLLGREEEFIKRYSDSTNKFAKAHVTYTIISLLPRYALEAIVFGGLLIITLYFLTIKNNAGNVLPLLALYALAGYRIMPSLQNVFRALTQIKFHLPSVDVLYADLTKTDNLQADKDVVSNKLDRSSVALSSSIGLHEISFRYPNSDKKALEDVTLRIQRNTTIAFVGPTGAGKTTLVDIILGLLSPTSGILMVDGTVITPENVREWQKRLGYVPQQIYISDDTILRNIAFGISDELIDIAAVERAARIANIHEFVIGLPDGYGAIVGERGIRLSGGQRQRIGIARALYHDPDVLIMDEGTSALDGITEDAVMQAIDNLSHEKTIILIAHRITTVQDCDMIYLMDEGRIVSQGNYQYLITSSPQFCAMAKVAAQTTTL